MDIENKINGIKVQIIENFDTDNEKLVQNLAEVDAVIDECKNIKNECNEMIMNLDKMMSNSDSRIVSDISMIDYYIELINKSKDIDLSTLRQIYKYVCQEFSKFNPQLIEEQ